MGNDKNTGAEGGLDKAIAEIHADHGGGGVFDSAKGAAADAVKDKIKEPKADPSPKP